MRAARIRSVLAAALIAGCSVFPASSPWNQRVDGEPVHARSAAMVRAVGLDGAVHPDFGAGGIGIPFQVVPRGAKGTKVTCQSPDGSDPGPYPTPPHPRIEGGSDRHMILVQRGTCRLYELFAARKRGSAWRAGSG